MATLQRLSDAGLNPFAAQLLVESYLKHADNGAVEFELSGVVISMRRVGGCEHGIRDGEWCETCNREYKDAAKAND